jgi:hypothetical protein
MSTDNLDSVQGNNVEERKQETLPIEEETKDGFVIVDNTYLDSVSEIHPLSNVSDFTRVNPMTAQTDFKHLTSMVSTFLIGPSFRAKPVPAANRNMPNA